LGAKIKHCTQVVLQADYWVLWKRSQWLEIQWDVCVSVNWCFVRLVWI